MPNSKSRGVAYDDPSFESLNVTGATTLDGNVAVGNAAADLVGFHGATATDQYAAITSISTSVAITSCGVYGFTTTQANGIITGLNSVLALLNEKGLSA